MSSLLNSVVDAGAYIAGSISSLATDLTGTRPHNVIDPCAGDSVIRKPTLPLCTSIPGGCLEEGTLVAITGTPSPSFSKRFRVDFILEKCQHTRRGSGDKNSGDTTDGASLSTCIEGPSKTTMSADQVQIAFHFNPRFGTLTENDTVVMNAKLGDWGEEEGREAGAFPFAIGTPFRMMILVEKECFKVAVDGKHCFEFKHRCNFKDIGRIHIEGNLSVDLLEFRKELKYLSRSSSSTLSSSSSSSSSSMSSPDSDHEHTTVKSRLISSPTLPYLEHDSRLGRTYNVYIAGLLPNTFKRHFVINLRASKADVETIPFHLSIRPEQQLMVRNSKVDGAWSTEELYLEGPFPFTVGTHFDLMICHRPESVSVAVNGQLAFEFKHRLDSSAIDTLEITGSQLITSVRYEFY